MKEVNPNPFDGAELRHPVDSRRQAVIEGKYAGGVFCRLPDGVTCLCLYSNHHFDMEFHIGDRVLIHITRFDYSRKLVYARIISKWYLDVANGSAAERSSCQQKIFNGADHEVWVLISNIAGYYQLIPRHAPAKRLTVINGGSVSGGNVGIMQYSSKLTSQDWQIVPNSRGHYVVKSKCSNNTMVLCVDPNSAMADGANVAQYPYTDDAAQQNDEWILEPFVLPCFEYDQGFFMYHAAYSGLAIQQALKAYGQEVFGILYNQFGLKARETFSEMTPSLSDDCHGMMYVCAHGYSDDCTNTFVTDHTHKTDKNCGLSQIASIRLHLPRFSYNVKVYTTTCWFAAYNFIKRRRSLP